jgi:hypothetical protein
MGSHRFGRLPVTSARLHTFAPSPLVKRSESTTHAVPRARPATEAPQRQLLERRSDNAPLAQARGSQFQLFREKTARNGGQSPALGGAWLPRRTNVHEGSPPPPRGGLCVPFHLVFTAPDVSRGRYPTGALAAQWRQNRRRRTIQKRRRIHQGCDRHPRIGVGRGQANSQAYPWTRD